MKLLVTLLVAALAALGGRRLGAARAGASQPESAPSADSTALRAEIRSLTEACGDLAREIGRRESTLTAPAPEVDDGEIDEAEIGAALARWRAAHPAETHAAAELAANASRRLAPDEVDLASIPMDEIVRSLAGEGLTRLDRQALFQKLRETGRIDEYVAAVEALAAADPENPELQVALGNAYLQKLFGVGNSPEAGPLAYKSDAAFDRALEIDDHSWDARFTKAVSLSNWPAFLGRGPEAIEHFEILLQQQAEVPPRPQFALTYLFLGNMYQSAGKAEKALETWKAGLARFPDSEDLGRAIELAGQ